MDAADQPGGAPARAYTRRDAVEALKASVLDLMTWNDDLSAAFREAGFDDLDVGSLLDYGARDFEPGGLGEPDGRAAAAASTLAKVVVAVSAAAAEWRFSMTAARAAAELVHFLAIDPRDRGRGWTEQVNREAARCVELGVLAPGQGAVPPGLADGEAWAAAARAAAARVADGAKDLAKTRKRLGKVEAAVEMMKYAYADSYDGRHMALRRARAEAADAARARR